MRMDTNPPRATQHSVQPLSWNPQRHWAVIADTVQYPTTFIPFLRNGTETPVEDGTKRRPLWLTPRERENPDQRIFHWRRFLPAVAAHIEKMHSQEYRPQEQEDNQFQHEWWWKSSINVLRDQIFFLPPKMTMVSLMMENIWVSAGDGRRGFRSQETSRSSYHNNGFYCCGDQSGDNEIGRYRSEETIRFLSITRVCVVEFWVSNVFLFCWQISMLMV